MTRSAYSIHPTPVGEALLLVTGDGLAALEVLHTPPDVAIERLSHALGRVPDDDPSAAADVADQLDAYFEGERRVFDLTLDWRLAGDGFVAAALRAVCDIPYGETASYGEVAVMAGRPRAHRAVGSACAATPFSLVVPVHRVVRADGSIGEYGGHPEVKRFLLDLERDHEAALRARVSRAPGPPSAADAVADGGPGDGGRDSA